MHAPEKYAKITDLKDKPQYDAAIIGKELYESLIVSNCKFKRNSLIKILLIIINLGSEAVQFHYDTDQSQEFVIKDQMGRERWKWSTGKTFLHTGKSMTLSTEKSKVYAALGRIPKELEPGYYILEGWNTAKQVKEKKLKVSIIIIP